MGSRPSLTEAEKDDVVRRYVELKQSQNFIAFALGSSQTTISRVLQERGVVSRPPNTGTYRRIFAFGAAR